jgi:hypothetical protein
MFIFSSTVYFRADPKLIGTGKNIMMMTAITANLDYDCLLKSLFTRIR